MKSIGVVRRVDNLGRIVIPKELLDTRGMGKGSPLEIYVDGEYIILAPYTPGCIICGDCTTVEMFYGKPVCHKCMQEIAKKKDALESA